MRALDASSVIATIAAIAGWTAFAVAILVGLALDLIGLFGNWLILAAIAIAWLATGFAHWGPWPILGMAGLAALGEIIEALAAAYGASKFGGERGAAVSALLGALTGAAIGAPFLFLLGSLVGACLGAFIGAVLHEILLMRRHPSSAARVGLGAAIGRIGGVLAKLLAGISILLVAMLTF